MEWRGSPKELEELKDLGKLVDPNEWSVHSNKEMEEYTATTFIDKARFELVKSAPELGQSAEKCGSCAETSMALANFMRVGTEVSPKFKGGCCEAKVKRIFKNIKFRAKWGLGWAKNGKKNCPSKTSRRSGCCSRAGRSTWRIISVDEKNHEDDVEDEDENNTSDETGDESHSDNEIKEATPEKSAAKSQESDKDKEKDKEPKKKTTGFAPGDLVMVCRDPKKTGTYSLAVVVNPKIYKALKAMKPLTGNDIPLRGFMLEGRYFSVSRLVLKPFTAKPLAGFEKEPHKTAYNRTKDFLESKGKTLPPSWNHKEQILTESTMKKKKDRETEKERDKDKDKDATSDTRDTFVAHFYKFQEDHSDQQTAGISFDFMHIVVHRLGELKQVCAKAKGKKVLMRMKLEGCPGATPSTFKSPYHQYFLLFSQQHTRRLGWSLSELTMPAGRRPGRLRLRQMGKGKEKEKEKMEKGEKEKEKDKDKTKPRKMSVDVREKKDKNDDRSEKEMSESSTKPEKVKEKPEITHQHQQQQSNKLAKKLDDEEKEKLSVKDKEKKEELAKAAKIKREHISPSPARSTASSASKDERRRKRRDEKAVRIRQINKKKPSRHRAIEGQHY
ncbi:unnamed protein product, partial [Mesorhabditis belari]|uniref:Uncharacterized protein n=1 Tax=Mesorhabditis belari TaxID=2138241 RepID=A0AAF3EMQ3_9BILA